MIAGLFFALNTYVSFGQFTVRAKNPKLNILKRHLNYIKILLFTVYTLVGTWVQTQLYDVCLLVIVNSTHCSCVHQSCLHSHHPRHISILAGCSGCCHSGSLRLDHRSVHLREDRDKLHQSVFLKHYAGLNAACECLKNISFINFNSSLSLTGLTEVCINNSSTAYMQVLHLWQGHSFFNHV